MATSGRQIGYLDALTTHALRYQQGVPFLGPGIGIRVTETELHLTVPVNLALECYQEYTVQTPVKIRSLTHFLPRKTKDPFVLGFAHRLIDDKIQHKIKLPTEILRSAIILQERDGDADLLQRFSQLFKDLQPVNDSSLLSGRRRKPTPYDTQRLEAAVCRHGAIWGFDPSNLVKQYQAIGMTSRAPKMDMYSEVTLIPCHSSSTEEALAGLTSLCKAVPASALRRPEPQQQQSSVPIALSIPMSVPVAIPAVIQPIQPQPILGYAIPHTKRLRAVVPRPGWESYSRDLAKVTQLLSCLGAEYREIYPNPAHLETDGRLCAVWLEVAGLEDFSSLVGEPTAEFLTRWPTRETQNMVKRIATVYTCLGAQFGQDFHLVFRTAAKVMGAAVHEVVSSMSNPVEKRYQALNTAIPAKPIRVHKNS